ncbi:MAG TPA: septum formation initiator family protein [Ignavibacteriaceae bacterium]|nr:septum formation initiator family protein [Ignavibacteriaceae bacterium]
MAISKSKRKYIIVAFLLIGILYVVFNEEGLLKMLKNKKELGVLQDSLKQVKDENAQLQGEIDSLRKKIPAKIERTAREKYNMKRPNERTIKIVEE